MGQWSCARWLGITGMLATLTVTAPAAAQVKKATVKCALGQSVAQALIGVPPGNPILITVVGACTENVVIVVDDVTLEGDAGGGSIAAADAARATILIEGARRVVIDGLRVTGGTGGIVGRRGATFDVTNSVIESNTRWGVLASYAATGTVDSSTVKENVGFGAVAANGASLVITNSSVQDNTDTGILAIRGGFVRVGQDADASPVALPVTVSGNGGNGVAALERASAVVLGGSIVNNARSGVTVTGGADAQIGVSGGFVAGTLVQNNAGTGVYVEGGTATILGSTISGNTRDGVTVAAAGHARIGIKSDSSAYAGNTISGNRESGVLVTSSASAYLGGNVISANGTNVASTRRFGITVAGASSATLIGNNTVQNHPGAGVFALRSSSVRVGDEGFGLPTANTITGNGATVTDVRGGVYAFLGSTAEIRGGATITGNMGAGVLAFEQSIVDIRNTTISSNLFGSSGFFGGHGINVTLGSLARIRDGALIGTNGGDGIQVAQDSAVSFAGSFSVTGNSGAGLRCTDVESSATSIGAGSISGNAGGNVVGCTGF